jgi:hypothetical protein
MALPLPKLTSKSERRSGRWLFSALLGHASEGAMTIAIALKDREHGENRPN